MAQVRIVSVTSYGDGERLRSFVQEALCMDPAIHALLCEGDPKRLVVVKPNWVQQSHEYAPDLWEPVITHPNVVLAVLSCLAETMGGRGTIAVCDGPHTHADIGAILTRGGFDQRVAALRTQWPQLNLEVIDLRREIWITREQVVVERKPNPPDPRGYVALNLGRNSLFYQHAGEGAYYGADYDTNVVKRHHCGDTQEYLLAGTPVQCDLFINLPKMKTHKKTGITCCLKNLVGINGDKNWLPHHTEGSPRTGGDEFPDEAMAHTIEQTLKAFGRQAALSLPVVGPWLFRKMRNAGKRILGGSEETVRNGNWSGNDTCWRMVLDLNRALLYGHADGTWGEALQPKRYLAIVDGIVGGEGNGPLCPDPVQSGVLLSGVNPAEVDAVAARLMGFDPRALPVVAHAFDAHPWPVSKGPLEEDVALDGRTGQETPLDQIAPTAPGGFRPHFGWTALREKGR
jgi:uncharacterized protein (DUF362 family)